MEIKEFYKHYLESKGVITDSRKVEQDHIFFALKGENFDGNKFAKKAIEIGAKYAIVDDPDLKSETNCILVKDSLEYLQELARYHRKQLTIPIIAITGSNGKTTTKELVRAVLSSTYSTFATHGNLNNHIGVPLSLLSVNDQHEMAVIEMGANHLHEINFLCGIALPNFGLITNIGKAHLEGFGSEKGVQIGKGELFEFLEKSNGRVFANANDPKVVELAYYIQKVNTYGTGKFLNTNGEILDSNTMLKVKWLPKKAGKAAPIPDPITIETKLVGKYNLDNVLAAIAIGTKFKVHPDKIKESIENYIPSNNRSQIVEKDSNTIILDAYNANPSSMNAAIENLAKMPSKNKIAFLGDMLELGQYSIEEHQKIVDQAKEANIDTIILVGPEFQKTSGEQTTKFESSMAAKEWFISQDFQNHTILIKGSRGIKMEKIVE